jgi:SAM-dependent methyltransferase
MRNLLNEKPDIHELPAYNQFLCDFVAREDIEGKTVLDLGCGFGWFSLFAESLKAAKIIGVEPTLEDLATAKPNESNKVSFLVADALKLPFANSTFDTVVSWEVIEHLPVRTEIAYFQEVSRVLKAGGKFYLSTPYASLKSQIFDPAWLPLGHRHYKVHQLIDPAQSAGLSALKVVRCGSWGSVLFSLNMYFSKWILRRRPLFNKLFYNWVTRELKGPDGDISLVIKFCKS